MSLPILYLVYDKKNNTCTPPAFAESLAQAEAALSEINPENISDLIIHPLLTISNIYDFFLLSIDTTKSLPDFIFQSNSSGDHIAEQPSDSAVADPVLEGPQC